MLGGAGCWVPIFHKIETFTGGSILRRLGTMKE
jgi:hypothetical protein